MDIEDFWGTNFYGLYESIENLPADAECPFCRNSMFIECTDHGGAFGEDEDGLCPMCQRLADDRPGIISCPCDWIGY